MRLNFMANSFAFGCKNCEYTPRTFSAKLAGKELKNASELHRKQLRFWMHRS